MTRQDHGVRKIHAAQKIISLGQHIPFARHLNGIAHPADGRFPAGAFAPCERVAPGRRFRYRKGIRLRRPGHQMRLFRQRDRVPEALRLFLRHDARPDQRRASAGDDVLIQGRDVQTDGLARAQRPHLVIIHIGHGRLAEFHFDPAEALGPERIADAPVLVVKLEIDAHDAVAVIFSPVDLQPAHHRLACQRGSFLGAELDLSAGVVRGDDWVRDDRLRAPAQRRIQESHDIRAFIRPCVKDLLETGLAVDLLKPGTMGKRAASDFRDAVRNGDLGQPLTALKGIVPDLCNAVFRFSVLRADRLRDFIGPGVKIRGRIDQRRRPVVPQQKHHALRIHIVIPCRQRHPAKRGIVPAVCEIVFGMLKQRVFQFPARIGKGLYIASVQVVCFFRDRDLFDTGSRGKRVLVDPSVPLVDYYVLQHCAGIERPLINRPDMLVDREALQRIQMV